MASPIYPACAGINPMDMPLATLKKNLPRVCGDQPGYTFVLDYWCEFPPRVRGSTHADPRRWFCSQIYPACAGITLLCPKGEKSQIIYPACAGINLSDCPICGCRIHLPRVRGDQPREGAAFEQVFQFTPHARGSTQGDGDGGVLFCIYPACAGIILYQLSLYTLLANIPDSARFLPRGIHDDVAIYISYYICCSLSSLTSPNVILVGMIPNSDLARATLS